MANRTVEIKTHFNSVNDYIKYGKYYKTIELNYVRYHKTIFKYIYLYICIYVSNIYQINKHKGASVNVWYSAPNIICILIRVFIRYALK